MAHRNLDRSASEAPEPIPKLRDGIDLTRLGLTAEEGMVASRIDGRCRLSELAMLVGKTRAETERLLQRLASVGVVVLEGPDSGAGAKIRSGSFDAGAAGSSGRSGSAAGSPAPSSGGASALRPGAPAEAPSRADYGKYIFPVGLMSEDVDLSDDEKKRIIFFHEHLEQWTAYELLQAKRKDDAKTVKRAYFERSKEWHPDRFRRPRLGSYKKMIDAIFREIQNAYNLLSSPERRAEYDRQIVFMADEDAIAEMLSKQRKEERERRREEEAVERRKERNPIRQRMAQSAQFYEEALALKAKGELLDALRAAQMAEAYGTRPEYAALAEELKVAAGELRIGPLMRRGLAQESLTNWDVAIETFQEAVRIAPEHGPARLRLAFNLLMGRRDPHEISTHAQRAVALLPNEPEAHFVLGLCYERAGMEKAALRALGRAVELKPNYEEAKKRLKKLKWGF
jgi:tetratricopeptide (TPR) repeat protein